LWSYLKITFTQQSTGELPVCRFTGFSGRTCSRMGS